MTREVGRPSRPQRDRHGIAIPAAIGAAIDYAIAQPLDVDELVIRPTAQG